MYSYKKENGREEKKAKGMKKSVIEKDITHKDYLNILLNRAQMQHSMNTIRSNKHQLGSYKITKTSLSCFDDKRYTVYWMMG